MDEPRKLEPVNQTGIKEYCFEVQPEEDGLRLDRFLVQQAADQCRSFWQRLIDEGQVLVQGQPGKNNYRLHAGEAVQVAVPPPEPLAVVAEEIPLDILYEDQDLIVVNKARGMVVHPAHGNICGTLVNALLAHCGDLSGINGVLRPGIVHRIDKDTSGVLVVAKNDFAHLGLAGQIKDHTVTRRYQAVVHGRISEPHGTVDAPIGRDPRDRQKMAVIRKNAKEAVTHYRIVERFRDYTYLEATLETGRTHQIRVHLSFLGHPVVGDPKYGPRRPHFNLTGQLLHAAHLGFQHPRDGRRLEFTAPLPSEFEGTLADLRQGGGH